MPDAPYSGGFVPGGRIYAVDGDFTVAAPSGAPEIYHPLEGDNNPSGLPIVLMDRSIDPPNYVLVPFGQGFNQQPFNANQTAIIITQKFIIAEAHYVEMPLNTLYNPDWSVGWGSIFSDLADCFLVAEGDLRPIGAGMVEFTRTFANLPPNRNERESYSATFPAIDYQDAGGNTRHGFTKIVDSRIFYEFFVFDEKNLLGSIDLFPEGKRLNAQVLANNGKFLNFEDFQIFSSDEHSVENYQVIGSEGAISDGSPFDPTHPQAFSEPTVPDYSTYKSWQFAAEIVAEASSFTRWRGNIFVRKTRFVVAL